jgi:hypothetical protein
MAAEGVVYVELLDEGVDVWRPVEAISEGGGVYRLRGDAPPDEAWAFPPGSRVRCEARRLSGDLVQVACALAD